MGYQSHGKAKSDVDLSSYDAIFIYLGTNDESHNFSSAEVTAYRGFIHDDSKKFLLSVGRSKIWEPLIP